MKSEMKENLKSLLVPMKLNVSPVLFFRTRPFSTGIVSHRTENILASNLNYSLIIIFRYQYSVSVRVVDFHFLHHLFYDAP
jgi:hypothetical protein